MKKRTLTILFYILPLPVVIISLLTGPSEICSMKGIADFFSHLIFPSSPEPDNYQVISTILIDVRLPRILLTFLTGAALAASGNGLQAIFRNPLVCPYILGISSGAAFGAALAIATGLIPVQVSAFVFGTLAVIISFAFAKGKNNESVISLILSGMIVSGLFTALLTMVQFISDPFRLQTIVHWTMGNLHNADWSKLKSASIPILTGLAGLYIFRWRLNILSFGDDESKTSGMNTGVERMIILGFATLATSASVAVAGIISMYGLFIPHIVRMVTGPDNRKNMIPNLLFGGSFLLIIDDISRSLTHFEIPIGVFTMLIAAPFFVILLRKTKTAWI